MRFSFLPLFPPFPLDFLSRNRSTPSQPQKLLRALRPFRLPLAWSEVENGERIKWDKKKTGALRASLSLSRSKRNARNGPAAAESSATKALVSPFFPEIV